MGQPDFKKDSKDSIKNGIAIAMSFLVLSIFLYVSPEYFGNKIATKIICILLGIMGVAGLGIELDKVSSKKNKLGLGNLGIGLA